MCWGGRTSYSGVCGGNVILFTFWETSRKFSVILIRGIFMKDFEEERGIL